MGHAASTGSERQCRIITLIWHPAQAAPEREISVFDQAFARDALAPTASVTTYSEATPTSGNVMLIALWLDGRPPATRRAYEADAAALMACLGGVPLRQATLADLQAFAASLARFAPAAAPTQSQERAGRAHPGGGRGGAADRARA
jgi:hypothetical protein